MKYMSKFPFITSAQSLVILRVSLALMLAAHGAMRLSAGTVDDFGGFLNSKGFVFGPAIAWFLTLFEMAGGLLMAAGYFVRWIAAIFIIEHCFGIVLVHVPNGWFVVGHQSGGVEYSVLIIIALLVIAASARR